MGRMVVPPVPYRAALERLRWVKDKNGEPFDAADARRVAWAVCEAMHESGYVLVERDRLGRLIAAADKLRRFSRSIVGYGGSVPESEALLDSDLEAA